MKKLLAAIVLTLAVLSAWMVWEWGFCRLYVPPNRMAVVTAKLGAAKPEGQLLAKPGQQGVLEDVLAEGRHFLNPLFYAYELLPAIYIPPGKAGLVTAKVGDELPPGEFLADDGQKGIRRRLLPPGRYRINPVGYQVDMVDMQSVPTGFVGVVTSLSGSDPAGGFARAGEKGVRADILQPGLYYINPREYQVAVVEVGVNQVSLAGDAGGVVATKSVAMDANNAVMSRLNINVAQEQQRQREVFNQAQMSQSTPSRTAQPPVSEARALPMSAPATPMPSPPPASLAAADPFAKAEDKRLFKTSADQARSANAITSSALSATEMADMDAEYLASGRRNWRVAIGGAAIVRYTDGAPHAASGFVLNQFVNFPSRDGFDISLDMTLEFELRPDKIPVLYRDYGDIGAVVDKIVMPQLLSVSRLRGSAYRATDFIAGAGREKFQNELTESLRVLLEEKNLTVHTALISHVNVPPEILQPLQVSSLSRETDLTNQELQRTSRKQAELNAEMGMIQQLGEKVVQETTKLKAEIQAGMEKKIAEIQADTLRRAAELERQTAEVKGQSARRLGAAQAEAHALVETERAKGWGMRVAAFADPQGFALYEMAESLNPDLKINLFHAGDGTLWTDLQGARLSDLGAALTAR